MWTSNKMIALYITLGLLVAAVLAWLAVRKTLRTRLKMAKAMRGDPDVSDWLVVFNWTPKVLYAPTIAAALIACLLMLLKKTNFWFLGSMNAEFIGGLWFAVLFINFLVEEYDISIKLLIITVVSVGFFLLWLHLLGWVGHFVRQFRHLAVSVSATGYLLVAIIGLLTIGISWVRGLFYYVTITPNYMNIQEGPTETGEQIGREDYNSRVDTTDFLERLLGFGKIIITFKDKKRAPISMLVWPVNKKAQMLERVRAKFAIDYPERIPSPPAAQHPEAPDAEPLDAG